VQHAPVNSRSIGAQHEQRALAHIRAAGLTLVQRNYNVKVGEIDLIASAGDQLIFIEVRFRSAGSFIDGLSSVGDSKRKRFIKAVKHYLLMHPKDATRPLRFDVISLSAQDLEWHQNAFDAGSGW
jgi:putative endonuclease